jgi:hypothetical protein
LREGMLFMRWPPWPPSPLSPAQRLRPPHLLAQLTRPLGLLPPPPLTLQFPRDGCPPIRENPTAAAGADRTDPHPPEKAGRPTHPPDEAWATVMAPPAAGCRQARRGCSLRCPLPADPGRPRAGRRNPAAAQPRGGGGQTAWGGW